MVTFVDRALVAYHDPTTLAQLLTGGTSGPYPRLIRLVGSVYSTDDVTVTAVSDLAVTGVTPLVRYELLETLSLTNTASQPTYAVSELRGIRRHSGQPAYADLVANLTLTIQATRDFGGIDTVEFDPIEDIQSFADFQNRFTDLDVDVFLAEHDITTVDELRTRYEYLRGELHFTAPTDDEKNPPTFTVQIPLALLLSEGLVLADALRLAADLRAAADAADVGRTDSMFGPPLHAMAIAIVFPADELGPGVPTADQIDTVFADAGVLPLFASPP
jgi:hypothetical protein